MDDLPPLLSKLPGLLRGPATVIYGAARGFSDDRGVEMAAGLAFYAVLSFAPFLVLVVHVAGWLVGSAVVEPLVLRAVGDVAGSAAVVQAVEVMNAVEQSDGAGAGSLWSLAVLLIGATTGVAQLQTVMDRVWGTPSERGVVSQFLLKRLIGLLLLATMGFLAFASVVVTSAISALGDPDGPRLLRTVYTVQSTVAPLVDITLTWLVFSAFFGLLFRVVPSTEIGWWPALRGGAVTAALFVAGTQGIGWYLGRAAIGSMYGAAGSLAALLTWVFYSSLIILFGAELTKSWRAYSQWTASRRGA